MAELLLGCGHSREKRIGVNGGHEWKALTTLDMNPNCGADHEWNLERLPLPFADNSYDEIHAYEVLEHVGAQGDWKFFFAQFADFWRILKPDGFLCFSCPVPFSAAHTIDPGHTRFIAPNTITYLNQPVLTELIGKVPLTDYRYFYRADFDLVEDVRTQDDNNYFILRAIKPSRVRDG